MKHTTDRILLWFVAIFFVGSLSAQSEPNNKKIIHGIIYKVKAGQSPKAIGAGVDVFIPGIDESKTDILGQFSLDISKCPDCKVGNTILIYVNSEYGYTKKEVTISNEIQNKAIEIGLSEHNTLMLTGLIRDKNTAKPLKDIIVRALIAAETTGIKTDNDGVFQIFIKKDNISTLQAITLSIADTTGVYQNIDKTCFINTYEPIIVDLQLAQNELGKIKSILVEEVLNNLQHIDNRLQLISYALFLSKSDEFDKNLDNVSRIIAPKFYKENQSGYNELILKANISSLRQSLNSIPLRQEFGRSMVENLVNSGLKESDLIFRYIDELNEVQRAEQVLIESMESLSNSKDTCFAQLDRVSLGWLSLRNKAFFCNLYSLQLITSLQVSNKIEINSRLSYHTYLRPNKLFDASSFTALLYQGTEEMYQLVEKKKENITALESCRDRQLEKYKTLVSPITPEDTWENVITKALIFRDLGRYEEAISAFEYYGKTFSATDPTADKYAKTAIAFTKEMHVLKIEGGVYIWKTEQGSHAEKANIIVGDIVIAINGTMINKFEDMRKYLLNISPNTPLKLLLLRYNSEAHSFEKITIEVPGKPIGISYMPI